jgi:ribosomal protein S18 acetylase RimI-like enzyme
MEQVAQVTAELADGLERHEETGNAESARGIGGEIWTRGDALVIASRPELGTGLNFACRIRSDDASVDRLIDEVSAWLSARGVAPHFRVSPLTRPADLAQRLARRGFVQTETETQMVLAAQDVEPASSARVSIEQIELGELERWVVLQQRGFGATASSAPAIDLTRAAVAFGGIRPFLARLEGVAVGAGMLIDWDGVFGIYGVATVPEARRQGVGTALVREMIRTARARDNAPICLQVETGSTTQHWYERLGLRVVYDRTGWTDKVGE